MNYEQILALYHKVKNIISYFNKITFNKLNQTIQDEVNKTSNISFKDWYDSIPTKLLEDLGESDNPADLEYQYSIPFFHLSDNNWAKAILSKEKYKREISNFGRRYSTKITKLSNNLVFVLKHSDLYNLTRDQREDLNVTLDYIQQNIKFINWAESQIKRWDTVDQDINISIESLKKHRNLFEDYFTVTKSDSLLNQIENDCKAWLKKAKLQSIKNIQDNIKEIWNELKEETIKKDIQIQDNLNIQRIFNELPSNSKAVLQKFDNIETLANSSKDQLINDYRLSSEEAKNLIDKAQTTLNEIKRSAYPKLNQDNLSDKELQLLALLKVNEEYPLERDKEVGDLINEINNLMDLLSKLQNLAINRYEANLLEKQDYLLWLRFENKIYFEYAWC
ncbi:hypothetical protein LA664_00175 [Lactobacillus amylolyticus]|nr:hypothetical protein [Lactobacillus amylolyticus]KRL19084.1 hypothetical protein FD39_GL001378 [Lactobacillus amylolyticus DSM 11664]QFY03833.1 hypothetical protein LA664_00175 [Lactobacillus amylolyticus]TDG63576.1 hypothetical protein C5L18_000655 [Lactobacillus amylolyticus]